jgi:uncharacterized protein (DUF1684 family)
VSGFGDDWQAWRDTREQGLRSPRGWLGITAIHWLSTEPQRFDDVPGAWQYDEHGTTVALTDGECLTSETRVLGAGVHVLGELDDVGLRFSFDDAVAEVAHRDSTTIVRPRHPDSPNLTAYRGTPCYPPDERWVVRGSFDPYAAPVATPGGAEDEVAVGEVVFEHAGAEHRLVAWGGDDGSLWILFRDATSGVTTYPANRQLLTAPPAPDGGVVVDFNRAYNMPCAYTDFATCPVAPAANTLPFAVEAGERMPLGVPVGAVGTTHPSE